MDGLTFRSSGPGYEIWQDDDGNPWVKIDRNSNLGETKKGFIRLVQTSWEEIVVQNVTFRHSIAFWRK